METAPRTAENVSIAHCVHMALEFAPGMAEYVPAKQSTQVEIKAAPDVAEYVPGKQSTQVEMKTAPDIVEYVPGKQSTQVETPDVPEYVPAMQSRQLEIEPAPDVPEYVPGKQSTQVEINAAPDVPEYVPATQSRQFEIEPAPNALPRSILYFPARQSVQGPASGPSAPALQVQSAALLLPALAYEFVGQFVQLLDAAAGVIEYWPTRQLMHEALPAAILYFPGTHAMHVAPAAPVYPGLQIQSLGLPLAAGAWELLVHAVHMLCPGTENVLAAHGSQSAIESAAVLGEKYPAPHAEHCIMPTLGL